MATATPWNSLAGRSAGDINFENTVRQWQAKTDARLQNPGLPDVAVAPGWDAFFGGLQRTKDTAAANGMGFKVNTSEMGQDAMPAMAPSYYSPQGTAYYNGLNKQLSDDTAQFKLNQSAVLMADAQRRSQADAMMQDYVNRDAVSRAMQPGLTRDQSLAAAGPMAPTVSQIYAQRDAQKLAATEKQAESAAKVNLENATATAKTEAAKSAGETPDTPEAKMAIEGAARYFSQTGKMPTNVRVYGDKGAFAKSVMARAYEINPNLALTGANYAATEGSMKSLQKTSDAAQAFLGTADKNAELLESSIKKIPDIGSPALNKPLRAFQSGISGDPAMSEFNTYLTSVQNEYAKIITNPNLAGQLSDSARHEAQTLLDPSATVPQIVASIRALRSEGGNRLTSIQDQLKTAQGRIGSEAQPAAPAATPAPSGGGLTVQAPNGKTYTFANAAQADAFRQRAGIR